MADNIVFTGCSKAIPLGEIPVLPYTAFSEQVLALMAGESAHCLNYFAVPQPGSLLFLCLIAVDREHVTYLFAHRESGPLKSLTAECYAFHVFERELHENFGIQYTDHPWLKPIRFPENSQAACKTMKDYPFYRIAGEELHEVGVGPVHAGVIEPGHFRFLCNGEKVLHLEIQLGYQHRGVEALMVETTSGLKRALLAESIAGDTAVGHSIAHAGLMEALAGITPPGNLRIERAIALELERIAMYLADSAALCTDVAYQLGQVVIEALRTIIINTTQMWCGNRFGKGLVRPFGSNYPLQPEIAAIIRENLNEMLSRYLQMSDLIFSMPSVLARFDGIGVVTPEQLRQIGAVGMAARMGGVSRDLRFSHPEFPYSRLLDAIALPETGDLYARAWLRRIEIVQSVQFILKMLDQTGVRPEDDPKPQYSATMKPDMLAVSLAEGWRGEICHTALTDQTGKICHYKVKDPSLHNWLALALAVRDQEISDFPVCNKSFNLSYCGHDL